MNLTTTQLDDIAQRPETAALRQIGFITTELLINRGILELRSQQYRRVVQQEFVLVKKLEVVKSSERTYKWFTFILGCTSIAGGVVYFFPGVLA